jgi:CRISPR-associated protein Csm1
MKLDKGQQSEYNAILLTSLLRDVFRFFEQIDGDYFEYDDFSRFITENKIDIDLTLLTRLIRKNGGEAPDSDESEAGRSDKNSEALSTLISKAASIFVPDGESIADKGIGFDKNERMQSLFSLLKTSEHTSPPPGFYQLQPLNPDSIFPVINDKISVNELTYDNLITGFSQALKQFKASDFNELFNGYWNLLKKYLWSVPLNFDGNNTGLSSFDYISLTSAVAASLYLFHKDNNSINEDSIVDDADKFLFVGGDLSGIQQFIFEIEQRNPKRLSKTLRGRSFFLTLLVEIVSLKILKEFNLPVSAKIMSSGGRFLILAPNTDDTQKRLQELQLEIEEEFFSYFSGKVTFILDYSITLNSQDFLKAEIKKKISIVNINLNESKLRKNFDLIKQKPDELERCLSESYERMVKKKVCNFCGIFPALKVDTEGDQEYRKCFICDLAEKIGHNIVSGNYILFGREEQPGLFKFLGIDVGFSDKPHKSLLSYSLKEGNRNEHGSIDFSISNFLPYDADYIGVDNDDEEKLCHFCRSNDLLDQCTKEERKAFHETHLSFQCIAAYSRFANKGRGVDKLAVFKADIDNLGYILQEGIPEDRYSLPHFTFLSRMLDLFFQDWLKSAIQEYESKGKKKYDKIYTVYSGGDDLLLIGPWYNIIEFAHFFRKKFQEFTCYNPDVTFSAGIALFSPHSPVTIAVKQAEENLEKSKSREEKNSITLFDTTIGWEQLDRLLKFAGFLDEKIRDDKSKIKVGFLHRLFKYRHMFMEAEEDGKIEGLRFHSLMNYDITRNIKQVAKKKEKGKLKPVVLNQKEIDELMPLFITGNNLDKELWRNLKIPLYIALYKNRGGK